jgi:hypothetical protein
MVARTEQDGANECIVSQEMLSLWYGDISGTQEGERPALETGTRGLVKGQ